MNLDKMTDKLKDVLIDAVILAKDRSNPELSSEHIFHVMFDDDDLVDYLKGLKADINELKRINDNYLKRLSTVDNVSEPNLNYYVNNAYNDASVSYTHLTLPTILRV